jgi:hypothetical protein
MLGIAANDHHVAVAADDLAALAARLYGGTNLHQSNLVNGLWRRAQPKGRLAGGNLLSLSQLNSSLPL